MTPLSPSYLPHPQRSRLLSCIMTADGHQLPTHLICTPAEGDISLLAHLVHDFQAEARGIARSQGLKDRQEAPQLNHENYLIRGSTSSLLLATSLASRQSQHLQNPAWRTHIGSSEHGENSDQGALLSCLLEVCQMQRRGSRYSLLVGSRFLSRIWYGSLVYHLPSSRPPSTSMCRYARQIDLRSALVVVAN